MAYQCRGREEFLLAVSRTHREYPEGHGITPVAFLFLKVCNEKGCEQTGTKKIFNE